MADEVTQCVLLADRHHGLSEGIRGLLETAFEVVVMVADERSLLTSAKRLAPTLSVVDLSLARRATLDWLSALRAECPGMRVIVISVHDEPHVAREAARAGADGFVLKRAIVTDLLPAVEAVLAGRRYP